MCVGISGVLTDSVFVLMCVDVCLRLCLFVRNKAVVCQNFRNGDERKQHFARYFNEETHYLSVTRDGSRLVQGCSGLGRRI